MQATFKTSAVTCLVVVAWGLAARGQTYAPVYNSPPVIAYAQGGQPVMLNPQQLDQMVAPIALYPDPLLSQLLAAATYPQDIAAARQWLQYFPNPAEEDIDAQPWDPSVKALVHYPSVLEMAASQPDWTAALGEAFVDQPGAVMDAVQRLRAKARAAGTLVGTPQQQVINDNGAIEILPVQPNVIYVPEYDSGVVYAPPPGVVQPWITFDEGFIVGPWLDLDWDWRHRRFREGVRWDRDWRHPDEDRARDWRHNPERPIPPPRFIPDRPHGVAPGRGWEHPEPPPGVFHPGEPRRPEQRPGERPEPRAPERPVAGMPGRPPQESHPVQQPPAPPERPMPVQRPVQRPTAPTPPPSRERPVQGLPRQAPTPPPVEHPAQRPAAPPPARSAPAPSPRPAPPVRSAPSGGGAFHSGGGGAGVQGARGGGSAGRH